MLHQLALIITIGVQLALLQAPVAQGNTTGEADVGALKIVPRTDGPRVVISGQSTEAERRLQADVWTLSEFAFLPPRLITIDIPGRGRRLVWYLVYRVVNTSKEPRLFVPRFELKTDTGHVYRDVVIPKAQFVIQATEDPLTPLANSVTICGLIPPSTEEGVRHAVYGVATWVDVDPETDAFSIFVRGLSNGFRVIDNPQTGERVVLHKELELRFARPGDEFEPTSREIRFLEAQWVYR